MISSAAEKDLFSNCRIRHSVSSCELTTFGVGKGVSLLIEPESVEILTTLLGKLDDEPLFLGYGSNIILPDRWIERPVIRFPKSLCGKVPKDSILTELLLKFSGDAYFAGTSLISLSRLISQAGRTGMEFAAGIPGSLGGALKMNAGAHGASISQVITGAVITDRNGGLTVCGREQLNFSYRHSAIKPDQLIVAAAILTEEGDLNEIRARRQSCLDYRTKTQPLKMPSAGSVFRNPVDSSKSLMAAAYYLEDVGLKGFSMNGVGYSNLHSNWLVRLADNASAQAVRDLVELGQKRVFEKYGFILTPEILLW